MVHEEPTESATELGTAVTEAATRPAVGRFGELLRRLRVDSGFTQEDLAERAAISARTVSDVERGLRSGVYRDTARRLADALRLAGAERAVFEQAARRALPRAGLRSGSSGDRHPVAPDMPLPLTRLVGRADELATIVGALQTRTTRVLTLVGPGGIGKTRLALEAATQLRAEFADGARFVSLDVTDDPAVVPSLIARELGLASVRKPMQEALRDHLRDRETLFVLDTFEHLLLAAAFIAELAVSCPRLAFLVTSRTPLGIRGEHEIHLAPLAVPDRDVDAAGLARYPATALFLERARAVQPDLALDSGSAATIAEVCRRLEGLPLALELAAVRLRHMPLATLQAALERRLDVLVGGPLDLPPRLQAMRDAIAWSYDLLPAQVQRLFRAVSVFAGGWTLALAERIGDEGDRGLLDEMTTLVDSNLVVIDEKDRDEPRFSMLDVIREFATEQAEAQAETEALAGRHAAVFADYAEAAELDRGGPSQERWYGRLQAEQDNMRAALAWAVGGEHTLLAQRLAGALWLYWRRHGDYSEARSWLDQVLTMQEPRELGAADRTGAADAELAVGRSTRRKVLWGDGWISYYQGDYAHVRWLGEELLRLARQDGDRVGIRNGLTIRALVAMAEQRFEDALGPLEESVTICRESCPPWLLATSLLVLGQATLHGSDLARSRVVLEEALSLYQWLGDRLFIARTKGYLGYVALLTGDTASAGRLFGASLTGFADLGERFGIAEELQAVAALRAAEMQEEQAAQLAGAAQALWASMSAQALASDRPLASRYLEPARRRIAAAAWRSAWRRGAALNIDEAVRLAVRRERKASPRAGRSSSRHGPVSSTSVSDSTPSALDRRRLLASHRGGR